MSIALRMTLWYALSAFAIVLAATGLLYLSLEEAIYREDLRDLAESVAHARLLARSSPTEATYPSLAQPAPVPPNQPQVYLRLVDGRARSLVETPGMAAEVPNPTTAELSRVTHLDGYTHEVTSSSGKKFLVLLAHISGEDRNDPAQFVQVDLDRSHVAELLAEYRRRLWLGPWAPRFFVFR